MIEEMSYVKNDRSLHYTWYTISAYNNQKDDYMGLIDGDVVLSKETVRSFGTGDYWSVVDEESDALLYAVGIHYNQAESVEQARKQYEDIEIELFNGQQPVYAYIFSVE